MKRAVTVSVLCVGVLALCSAARAHWNEGDPHKMHWPQLPDLNQTGMDVDQTWGTLADDFKCRSTGLITDIHIWGSWADDILPGLDPGQGDPQRDPGNVMFRLSLHTDIPADHNPLGYSMPGPEVWHMYFEPGQFQWRLYAQNLLEWWYDPATPTVYWPGDTKCYQYNFQISEALAYPQEEGQTYWLDLKAFPWDWINDPPGMTGTFGWKTSLDHWNDDAVWWNEDLYGEGVGGWAPLIYPPGGWDFINEQYKEHPLAGQSIDLAFVITPEPATLSLLALGGLFLLRRRAR